MSKYQFKLPDIGEGIAEGTIGEWHVKPGDKVEVDGDLVQIENDKSVEEIPSPVSGTVTKILVEEGETAEVGQPLIELEVAEGEGNVADDAPAAETEKEEKKVEPYVDNLTVELLTPNKIRPTDKIEFEISYDVLKDVETHIVFSLTDIDRRIWMYNDNATNIPTTGTGHKSYRYTCSLGQVNNMKLRLEVTILGKSKEMYAFANSENSPLIVVNRDDIPLDDLSALDSATGIIQRNGKWDILSE